MKIWLSLALMATALGCDGGTKTIYVPCPDCIPTEMAGGAGMGGDGAGGLHTGGTEGEAGGGGGAGGDDDTGDGGAGGDDDTGDGGAGGDTGGTGGDGDCVPQCDGRVCGPDRCGGTCGTGCDDGAICSDGACIQGDCPDNTFTCGDVCADLLTDPDHCGSCGNTCADAWTDASPIDGLSFQDAHISARCVDATCVYQCEGSDADSEALLTDVDHCGACNTACDVDVPNKVGDTCVDGTCTCLLLGETPETPSPGVVCEGWCEVASLPNCNGECCPRLMGNNRVEADVASLFGFDMPTSGTARIFTNFPRGGIVTQLFRYEADGSAPAVESWLSFGEPRTIPILPAGRYALLVMSSSEPGVVTFARSQTATDFVAPGSQIRDASASTMHATFRVPADGEYELLFEPGPNGNHCSGRGIVGLFDSAATPIATLADMDNCLHRFSARWRGPLSAGLYTVRAFAENLRGEWQVRVAP